MKSVLIIASLASLFVVGCGELNPAAPSKSALPKVKQDQSTVEILDNQAPDNIWDLGPGTR